jgi:hypothetical protein
MGGSFLIAPSEAMTLFLVPNWRAIMPAPPFLTTPEAREAATRVTDWAAIITARAIAEGTTPLSDDARREIIAIFRGIRDARERDAG